MEVNMNDWIFPVLMGALAAVALLACGYLVACAGAQRWLNFREWWSGSNG
jgi:hypothetical protein